jgi:hypothetical protein
VILFVFARDDNVVHVGENIVAYLAFEHLLGTFGIRRSSKTGLIVLLEYNV